MFKKIKKAFNRFLLWIKKLTKIVIPIAVDVAELIKRFKDHPSSELFIDLIKLIPGASGLFIDKINKFLEEDLVDFILNLKKVEAIATIEDKDEQLKAIIGAIEFSSKEEENEFYARIAASLAEKLSDGRFTYKEAYELTQEVYQLKKALK